MDLAFLGMLRLCRYFGLDFADVTYRWLFEHFVRWFGMSNSGRRNRVCHQGG